MENTLLRDDLSSSSDMIPFSKKNETWRKNKLDFYINFRYTNGSNNRSDRNVKIINYNLYNGKLDPKDIEALCDPLGIQGSNWEKRFMHYDKISKPIDLLLGDEASRPDNQLVISESPQDLTRKTSALKDKIIKLLQQQLMAEIDPSTIDPKNPPPTPEQVLKAERMNPSDIIESKANRLLKILKKKLNTKIKFTQGFKDALIAAEEIYWTGILNNEPYFRKCNPLNTTIIMDDDSMFIDDAVAVIEERMLTVSSIIDEYGDDLTDKDLKKLDDYSRGTLGGMGNVQPIWTSNTPGKIDGTAPTGGFNSNNANNYSLRVVRVEFMSQKEIGFLTFTDPQTGELKERLIVDADGFNFSLFKEVFPDAKIEWDWINEPWEGVKIAQDIYLNIQPKLNQRRRMDNPYFCRLGYDGFIYNATNSKSVSLVDRLKPYQYLYNIIQYRLMCLFESDLGKVLLMDMAQMPKSEGIDTERWFYYLKEMKVAFINSFEEGKKQFQGQRPTFNQFGNVDLGLTNAVQQYINYLDYLNQQIFFVSGVNPQRMGMTAPSEAVTNAQQNMQQSSMITEVLFDTHQEVKRRVYTSLIEVAKIAYRKGKSTQWVNDDLGIEMLNIEEFEFDNSEFNVFVSNLAKDKQIQQRLEQLGQEAMKQGKADISTMLDSILNDSPKDIINIFKKAEAEFYQRQQEGEKSKVEHEQLLVKSQQEHEQAIEAFTAEEKQKDRDLEKYIADENNRVKIETAEISAFGFEQAPTEVIDNTAELALKQQELASKQFTEQQKIAHDKSKHQKELDLKREELEVKKKELKTKQALEDKKASAEKSRDMTNKILEQRKLQDNEKERKHQKDLEKLKGENALKVQRAKPKPSKK